MRLVVAAVLVLGLGCKAESPGPVGGNLGSYDAGGVFADTLVSYGDAADPITCTETLPACGEVSADCGPTDVLGAPDAAAYVLPAGGRLEVAFRCAEIVEKGSPDGSLLTFEFQILATVDPGSEAVVEVSYDGSSYLSLNTLTEADQSFDLAREDIELIRFVRIADQGSGGISIDAIAGL